VLFENNSNHDMSATSDQVYLHFRKSVINLVLSTDIASPERTQIGKSKWKEAFGDPFETVERKLRAEQTGQRRRSLLTGRDFEIPTAQHLRRGTGQTGTSELSSEGILYSQEEEDSLSGTPEGSQHDPAERDESFHDDGGGGAGDHPLSPPTQQPASVGAAAAAALSRTPGGMSVESATSGTGSHSQRHSKWERRLSTTSRQSQMSARYRQRLGIMRTVDLSGETIETYSHAGSRVSSDHAYGAASVISSDHAYTVQLDLDEPDSLKLEVIMETIMTAADVAHNLQGFEQMVKWSNKLYLELRKAYVTKRGIDPQPRWFENQIGFLESYLLPLAHRLEDTGVFPNDMELAKIVEDNRDRWLTEGYDAVQAIIKKAAEEYPLPKE